MFQGFERAVHAAAAIVIREIAVDRVRARFVGPELEADGLSGLGALGDAVLVDREAVRDVVGGEGDLHHVVLRDLDAAWRELEALGVNRKFALGLRREGARGGGKDDSGDYDTLHSRTP